MLKILEWDTNDSTFTDLIKNFYNSSDIVQISKTLMIKKKNIEFVLSTDATKTTSIPLISQSNVKFKDLNILTSKGADLLYRGAVEKVYFEAKSSQKYSHSNKPEIYNKFENFLDLTTEGMLSIPLQTIHGLYTSDSTTTQLMSLSDGCLAKHIFNIKTVEPNRIKSYNYSNLISYYQSYLKDVYLFKNFDWVIRSTFSINRFLQDMISSIKRTSLIVLDTIDDQASLHCYSLYYNNFSLKGTIKNIQFPYSHLHLRLRSNGEYEKYFDSSNENFDFYQTQMNFDNVLNYTLFNITPEYASTPLEDPMDIIFDGCPQKQNIISTILGDFSIDLSSYIKLDSTSVSSCEILDFKTIKNLGNTYSSVYNLKITDTNNKFFYVPIELRLSISDSTVSAFKVLDNTQCIIHPCNNLNTTQNSSFYKQTINQDIYTISQATTNQSYSALYNKNDFSTASTNVISGNIRITSASGKLSTIDGIYQNKCTVIDRNIYRVKYKENFSNFTIIDDYAFYLNKYGDKSSISLLNRLPYFEHHIDTLGYININNGEMESLFYNNLNTGDSTGQQSASNSGSIRCHIDYEKTQDDKTNIMFNMIDQIKHMTYNINGYTNYNTIKRDTNSVVVGSYYDNINNILYFLEYEDTEQKFSTFNHNKMTYNSQVISDSGSVILTVTKDPMIEIKNYGFRIINKNDHINKYDVYINGDIPLKIEQVEFEIPEFIKKMKCGIVNIANDNTIIMIDSYHNLYETQYTIDSSVQNYKHAIIDRIAIKDVGDLNHHTLKHLIRNDKTCAFGTDGTGIFAISDNSGIEIYYDPIYNTSIFDESNTCVIYDRTTIFQSGIQDTSIQMFGKKDIDGFMGTIDNSVYENYLIISYNYQISKINLIHQSDVSNIELFGGYVYDISTSNISHAFDVPSSYVSNIFACTNISDSTYAFIGNKNSNTILQEGVYDNSTNIQTQRKNVTVICTSTDFSSYRPGLLSQLNKVNNNSYVLGSPNNNLFSINITDASTATLNCILKLSVYNEFDRDFMFPIHSNNIRCSQNGSSNLYMKGAPFSIKSTINDSIVLERKYNETEVRYCLSNNYDYIDMLSLINTESKVLYDDNKYYILINNWLYIVCPSGEGFYNKSKNIRKNFQPIKHFSEWNYDNTMIVGYEFGDSIYFPISCINNQTNHERTFKITRIYKDNLGQVNIEHNIKGIYSNNSETFVQFSYQNNNRVNFAIDGNIYSYNPITDGIDNVNIGYEQDGKSNILSNNKKYACMDISNSTSSSFYSIDTNKQYLLPNLERESNDNSHVFSSVMLSGNSFSALSVGNNSYVVQPTQDSVNLNSYTLFNPRGVNEICAYVDDDNKTISSHNYRYNIINTAEYYSNIFSPIIDTKNFDANLSCINVVCDNKYQILGNGQYWPKGEYDKINVHKTLLVDNIMLRTVKVNDELCINNKSLRFLKSNNNISAFTFEDDKNSFNSNITINCYTDFSITTINRIADNSVTINGTFVRNWNVAIEYEAMDYGSGITNTYYKTSGKATLPTILDSTASTIHSFEIINDEINQNDITSQETVEVNNFYYIFNVLDATGNTSTIKTKSSYNSFNKFINNKESWLSYVSYYDLNDNTKLLFVLLPENNIIVKANISYDIDYYDDNETFFKNKFIGLTVDSTIDSPINMYYYIPIMYHNSTNILQMYSDPNKIMSSISLSSESLVNQDTGVQIVYKYSPCPDVMNVRYKKFNEYGYVYYECTLGEDGLKQNNNTKDVLTNYIIQNKNNDTSSFIIINNSNSIDITYSGRIFSKIYLGFETLYEKANQFYESTDYIVLNVNVKDMNSITSKPLTLLLNKNSQTYNVVGKKYQTSILDNTSYIDENIIINNMLFESGGILEYKTQSDYIFGSYLYTYYDYQEKSIKYLDLTNGLMYSLQNTYVYDGCILSKDSSQTNNYFSIWNAHYPFMQYLDKLPDIVYNIKNNLPLSDINIYDSQYDYIYDKTNLFIYNTNNQYVDRIKVKLDVITCIDQNKSLVDHVTSNYLQMESNKVFDLTNIMSYGYLVIKTKDRSREAPLPNRLIKIKFDTTFDLENLISVDTGSVAYNPFNSATLGQKMYEDLTNLNSNSSVYTDIKDQSSDFVNNLFFNFDGIDEPFKNFFETINDNTCIIEFYLEPSLNNEVIFIPFNLVSNLGCIPNSSNMPLSTFQKFYYPELSGSVSIDHRPEMYDIIESRLISRVDTKPYQAYNFSAWRSEVLPHDIIDFEINENSNKLTDWLSSFKDGTNIAKDHNIVIGFTHDPELSIYKKPIDPLYPWAYNGSINLSRWLGKGVTLNYPYTTHADGTFRYYDDISSDRIIFDITNISFPDRIQATIYFRAYNSSNSLVFDSQETIDTTNLNTHREVILGSQGISANRISINIEVRKGGFIFNGPNFILRSKGSNIRFIGIIKDGTQMVYNTFEKYICEDSMSILKMNLLEGEKMSVIVEKQPFNNIDWKHNLYVLGLDCELNVTHNKNYWYRIESSINSNASGFVVRLRPDNDKSVPTMNLQDEEENDLFNDINKFQLICKK